VDDLVAVEADRLRIRPDERSAEDATRPARKVVALQRLEEGDADLRKSTPARSCAARAPAGAVVRIQQS
jgi:hypothetical protein